MRLHILVQKAVWKIEASDEVHMGVGKHQGQRRRRGEGGGDAPGIGLETTHSLGKRPCRAEGKCEEGGVAGRKLYELTISPVPKLPVLLRVGSGIRSEVRSGKGERKGVGLIFVFLFLTT